MVVEILAAVCPMSLVRLILYGVISVFVGQPLLAADASTSKHFLWRVTNARAPFYLLGTMHSLRSSDWKFAPVIEDAIRQSHQFWFEIDPNRGDLFTKKITAAGKYPPGTHIKDKIDPKTYAFLVRITSAGQMGVWQQLKPWAIALFLFRNPRYRGFALGYGADAHVLEEVKMRSCPVGGIETMDEHVRVFSDMNDMESEVFLLQTAIYADEDAKNVSQSVGAWRSGNCEQMLSIFLPRMKEAPSVWWRILDHRNAMWIPRIETEIRSGIPTMICAGAMHFCGPNGVVALLEKRGYKIEQL
jgi:uncharacterized protein YbaP (TraB family)